MHLLRLGAVALLVLVVGCDTASDEISPLDDDLFVSVRMVEGAGAALVLATDGAPGCATPMAVDVEYRSLSLVVDVRGLDPQVIECRALIPSSWTTAIEVRGRLGVSIRHRGKTDEYVVTQETDWYALEAVRTSVTRPAAESAPRRP